MIIYRVKVTPERGRTAWLQGGEMAKPKVLGTVYRDRYKAVRAASSWLLKHSGGKTEIVKFVLVKEIT